jgi:glycosyltransferase involved in cell wall biosynthesis
MIGPSPSSAGGMAAVARCYIRRWDRSRFELRFVTSWASDRVSIPARMHLALRALLECCVVLLTWRPDVVHIHVAHKGSLYRKAMFVGLAKVFRVRRVILHCHAGPFPQFYEGSGRLAKALIRQILRSADLLVAVAEPWREYFRALCPGVPLIVLHNPVECPAETVSIQQRKPVLLSLGILAPEKGTYDILRAAPMVLEACPEAEFWFGGDGDRKPIRALTEGTPWSDRIRFLGWVDGKEKETCLTAASVFLLPSYAEGLPMAILEAMAYGIPVIATPVGGIPDAVLAGQTGLLVDPGDVAGLAHASIALLQDPVRRARMGENARRHALEHFAAERVLERLYSAYDWLLSGRAQKLEETTRPMVTAPDIPPATPEA